MSDSATIPLQYIGPLLIHSPAESFEISVPLATYETPLWPSVARGAATTKRSGGITTTLISNNMARSFVVDALSARRAFEIQRWCEAHSDLLDNVAKGSSSHLHTISITWRIVGSLLFARLQANTDDASGHNMITNAADHVLAWLCEQFPDINHVSVSGNYCTDKKNSSVNAILGRGKHVIAEATIPEHICRRYLSTSPQRLYELNLKKNLVGSIISGSIQSANAHFANMLLAVYLATGQDGANIVEGSQGITYCDLRNGDLYFSVSLPNIIVGTCGNGKHLPSTQQALQQLGCLEQRAPGENSIRLAHIIAATVLCGELSCLAAQTNPGELINAHLHLERSCRSHQ